jgi:hypothetical protein
MISASRVARIIDVETLGHGTGGYFCSVGKVRTFCGP